jgi:hypothetical protein
MPDRLYELVLLPDGTPVSEGFVAASAPEAAAIAPDLGEGDGSVRRELVLAGARLTAQCTREGGRALATVSQGEVPVLCSVLVLGAAAADRELLESFVASMHDAAPLRALARGRAAPYAGILQVADRPLWAAILIPVVPRPARDALLRWQQGWARAFFDATSAPPAQARR